MSTVTALVVPTLPPNGLGYGTTSFDQRMSNLAWMLDSNLGMRVACVSYDDGWDFHDSQVSRQAQNLSRLTGWSLPEVRRRMGAPVRITSGSAPSSVSSWYRRLWAALSRE